MRALVALLSGIVFGFGLDLGGMTNPGKVAAFLDFAGHWDPSLAFVMGVALLVATPSFWMLMRRSRPLLDETFHLPTKKKLDADLIAGSALFGIGWGLSGLCPGPAVADLVTGIPQVFAFVVAMMVGSYACDRWRAARASHPLSAPLGDAR